MIELLKKYWYIPLIAAIVAYWYFTNRKATANTATPAAQPDDTIIVQDSANPDQPPAIAEGEPVPGSTATAGTTIGAGGSSNTIAAKSTGSATFAGEATKTYSIG